MSASAFIKLQADIREALRTVIDPELGYNIVDLGLVYDIAVKRDGVVDVVMTTTTRFCPATGFIREAVEACVSEVPGVTAVKVELTYDPPWGAERMAPEIARQF